MGKKGTTLGKYQNGSTKTLPTITALNVSGLYSPNKNLGGIRWIIKHGSMILPRQSLISEENDATWYSMQMGNQKKVGVIVP